MQDNSQEDYISLKDIFLKIGEYLAYVKKKAIWIILVGAIFGFLMGFKNKFSSVMYTENLTFMMDETKSDSEIPGLDVLGSLFGGQGKQNNLGKILQLFESRRIIHNTLFDTVIINDKNDFIANHYLELYTVPSLVKSYKFLKLFSYKESWPKQLLDNPDFRFDNSDVDNFTPLENLYLRLIYEHISGNSEVGIPAQLNSKLDDETGIMSLKMRSKYEEITLCILNNIYTQLSSFFIEKTVEKETKTYNIMKNKRDSVYTALTSAEYALADFKDRNRKLVTVKGYLKQIQLEREASILGGMYSGVVRQMDATEFALKNKTPVVQVIDFPRRPVNGKKASVKKGIVFGGLIGVVLTIFFFIMRKLFQDIME